ncbi:hypothetical protein [Embleya sp. NBC_00896]|uniref:hypothetical protein n=1 Tax=Embleya sp. NBC_00896 TaxID=2975961 RepID=UPI002F911FD2|nr:hypothetical protein OG928_48550 [Embleya sp. NBC_00896]
MAHTAMIESNTQTWEAAGSGEPRWIVGIQGSRSVFTVDVSDDHGFRIMFGRRSVIRSGDDFRTATDRDSAEIVISEWFAEHTAMLRKARAAIVARTPVKLPGYVSMPRRGAKRRRIPTSKKLYEIAPFAPGDHVEWIHEGDRYTGQVWCEDVQAYGRDSAVVVQHKNGRPVARVFTVPMNRHSHRIEGCEVVSKGNANDAEQLGLFAPPFPDRAPETVECLIPAQPTASDPHVCPSFPRERYLFEGVRTGVECVTFDVYERPKKDARPVMGVYPKGARVFRVESVRGGIWQAWDPSEDDPRVASGGTREIAAWEYLRTVAAVTSTRRDNNTILVTVTIAQEEFPYEVSVLSGAPDNRLVIHAGKGSWGSEAAVIARTGDMIEGQALAVRHAQGRLPVLGAGSTPDDYNVETDWKRDEWSVTHVDGAFVGVASTWREGNALAAAHAERAAVVRDFVAGRDWTFPKRPTPVDCDHTAAWVKVDARDAKGSVTLDCGCGHGTVTRETELYGALYRSSPVVTGADVPADFVRDVAAGAGYDFASEWSVYGDALYRSVMKAAQATEGTRVERRIDHPEMTEGMGSRNIVQRGTVVACDRTGRDGDVLTVLWDGDWGRLPCFARDVRVVDPCDVAREREAHVFAVGDKVIKDTGGLVTGDERVGVVLEGQVTSAHGGRYQPETFVRVWWSDGFDDGPMWQPTGAFLAVPDSPPTPADESPDTDPENPPADASADDNPSDTPARQVSADAIVHPPMTRACSGFPRATGAMLGTHQVALEIARALHARGRRLLGARYEEYGFLPTLQPENGWWVEYGIQGADDAEHVVRVTRQFYNGRVHSWDDCHGWWRITIDGRPITRTDAQGRRVRVELPRIPSRQDIAYAIHAALPGQSL